MCGDDANVQKVSGLCREQSSQSGARSGLANLLRPPAPHYRAYHDAGSGGHPLGWIAGYSIAALIAVPSCSSGGSVGLVIGFLIVMFLGTVLGIVGAVVLARKEL